MAYEPDLIRNPLLDAGTVHSAVIPALTNAIFRDRNQVRRRDASLFNAFVRCDARVRGKYANSRCTTVLLLVRAAFACRGHSAIRESL